MGFLLRKRQKVQLSLEHPVGEMVVFSHDQEPPGPPSSAGRTGHGSGGLFPPLAPLPVSWGPWASASSSARCWS